MLFSFFSPKIKKLKSYYMTDRCIVGSCDDDKRYLERMIVHSNVKEEKMVFHGVPVNDERQKAWIHVIKQKEGKILRKILAIL